MSNKYPTEIDLHVGSRSDGFLSAFDSQTDTYFYRRSRSKILTLGTFFVSQAILFFKLLKYRKKNVRFYINTILPFGGALAGWVMRKEVIYHVHETSVTPKIFKLFLRSIVNITASKVIFVSQYLHDVESFDKAEQFVVYNSLSKDFWDAAARVKYPCDSRMFNVLMACSLRDYKGVTEFIRIASMCADKNAIQFTLILNASDDEITDYFSKSELTKNVGILARQSDLKEFYSRANLVLNLSKPDGWVETFGLTILEAMAFGIPVIVPAVGGPVELVRDGRDGYLMSSLEWPSIGDKIIELSYNRELCRELSISARKRAGEFSALKFQKEIEDLLITQR
ncbi:glycosyltransferase family 4 protein [Pseudomonadales bacterium]|nr:glycosyltransferase family 4 protein [Pseudomonadales bacterium]